MQAGGAWTARSQPACEDGEGAGRALLRGLLPPVILPQELQEKRLLTNVPMDLQVNCIFSHACIFCRGKFSMHVIFNHWCYLMR